MQTIRTNRKYNRRREEGESNFLINLTVRDCHQGAYHYVFHIARTPARVQTARTLPPDFGHGDRCACQTSLQNTPVMKTTRKVWASLLTLLAACLVHAADTKPVARVISILEIETDDPSGYAIWITQYNAAAKARTGVDNFVRVYETLMDGEKTNSVRAVAAAASVAELTKHQMALESDPAILQAVSHLRGMRKMGSRLLYQAVRYDGSNKNGSLYTTQAVVTDEAGYLKALDQLRALFDANGLKDAKINAYRVLAGRTDHTHHIVINTPSPDRLAAVLDQIVSNQQMADWIAASGKFRTVVRNGTSREITK